MATPAQCYFCFEVLLASFEDREPATLAAVEALWEQHEQTKKLSDLEDQLETDTEQQSVNEDEDASQLSSPQRLQIPRVSRLQGELSASSSTSPATTPSSASNASANSLHSSSTNITTPSSAPGARPQLRSPDQRFPLFVTWNTLSRSGNKSLRGCIGTFEGQELAAGLKSYALTSYVVSNQTVARRPPSRIWANSVR